MVEGIYTLGAIYAPGELEESQTAFVAQIDYYFPMTEDSWKGIVEVCSENERDLMTRTSAILRALNNIDELLVSMPEVGYL